MLNLGGTYRSLTPEQTLAKIEPMMSHFGITRVANITGLDDLKIPTYIAIRPLSKLFATAQGKGMTHELAKISALMESIEGWHAEHLQEPPLFGSVAQLANDYPLVDVELLVNPIVQMPLDRLKTIEIPWTKGWELNSEREIYFPADLIHLDLVSAHELTTRPCWFVPTSNGLAAGNTYEEAVCHAMAEVVERHCEAQLNPRTYRHIDPQTITSPHIQELLATLHAKKLRLQLIDMTDSIQVPAYMATLTDLNSLHAQGVFFGSGAHLSSEVALSRAITEAVQSRLTIIGGSREDIYHSVYRELRRKLEDVPKHPVVKQQYPFIETPVPADFNLCLLALRKRLQHAGFDQIIVYEHTQKEIGIPVVHVLIPGLMLKRERHIHYAYSYDDWYP